ncbi:hypothetical protein GJ496_007608, partial [Pomphorhynchus laevis]
RDTNGSIVFPYKITISWLLNARRILFEKIMCICDSTYAKSRQIKSTWISACRLLREFKLLREIHPQLSLQENNSVEEMVFKYLQHLLTVEYNQHRGSHIEKECISGN